MLLRVESRFDGFRSSSRLKSVHSVLRTRTSQDFLCGSKMPEKKPSFLDAENDLVRRSSGRKAEADAGGGGLEEEGLKRALRAEAAAEEGGLREEEEAEAEAAGAAEEEEEEGSKSARRSQRHEGQKPVKCSSGWRSQVRRWGCGGCGGWNWGSGGGGGSVVGFITGGGAWSPLHRSSCSSFWFLRSKTQTEDKKQRERERERTREKVRKTE